MAYSTSSGRPPPPCDTRMPISSPRATTSCCMDGSPEMGNRGHSSQPTFFGSPMAFLWSIGTYCRARSLRRNPRGACQCLARHSLNQIIDPGATAASPLTVEQARTIVAPLYDALNQPAKKDVAALLAKATNPDYRSYSTNEDWLTRDQLADVFRMLGAAVPDLRWTIEDIQT